MKTKPPDNHDANKSRFAAARYRCTLPFQKQPLWQTSPLADISNSLSFYLQFAKLTFV
jgi:hypothetical protein